MWSPSRTIVSDAYEALQVLDNLHFELVDQRDAAQEAMATAHRLNQLCDGMAAADEKVDEAAAVAEQWAIVQNRIAGQRHAASSAERSLDQIAEVNRRLVEQSAFAMKAERNLERLVGIAKTLCGQSESLTSSTLAMQKLINLQAAVEQATLTIDEVQHLVVDICLSNPAATQALASVVTRPMAVEARSEATMGQEQDQATNAGVYQAIQTAARLWLML